jgi:hypothetical protein
MEARQVDALVSAAGEGVDSEWLSAHEHGDGYDLSVTGGDYEALTETQFRDALRDHPGPVEEWYFWTQTAPGAADRVAFLRWVERAGERSLAGRREALREGVTRTWGQLRIRAVLTGSGGRRYELRHVDDADAPVESLDARGDPLEARDVARTDRRGRYRPLPTAPTLPGGWVFPDLGPRALVRTVDTFYPATVANWYRERAGELDVTHWHEAMARQTGIYGVVGTWDRGEGTDHVEWVAEACCADSQCLKRREWEYDAGTELDAGDGPPPEDGPGGVFPCREPCSLVVAAARTWTRLEAQETRSYEFELTPGEKAQLEAIVDAVADGRAGEIREADFDDGANRYRARFLRAKLFEDGTLPTVPADGNGDDTPAGGPDDADGH